MATGASNGASAAKKKREGVVTLMSGDGESFEVEAAAAAALSVTIRHAIEDGCADRPIPLPVVGARALALAVEYCRKHHSLGGGGGGGEDSAAYGDELRTFDRNLVKVDRDTLFDLMEAANYLEIEGLLNLTCRTVAEMMQGKSIEELRRTFNVPNDYTPEEEEEVRREVSWALD